MNYMGRNNPPGLHFADRNGNPSNDFDDVLNERQQQPDKRLVDCLSTNDDDRDTEIKTPEPAQRFATFAKFTADALEHVARALPGMSLHDRVAIIVPTNERRVPEKHKVRPIIVHQPSEQSKATAADKD